MLIGSKKALEVILSKTFGFCSAKVSAEQYLTPSDIASEVLWKGFYSFHIENKIIADLGSGTGRLGIGCLLLGAKKVYFVESDPEAMKICKSNIGKIKSEGFPIGEVEFVEKDVSEFIPAEEIDTVVTNPPFGTRDRHSDLMFLEKAMALAKVSYSFHKTVTSEYLVRFGEKKGFMLKEKFDFDFMLWNTMKHHTKKKEYIKVSCLVFEKRM
jgi:putative methylase